MGSFGDPYCQHSLELLQEWYLRNRRSSLTEIPVTWMLPDVVQERQEELGDVLMELGLVHDLVPSILYFFCPEDLEYDNSLKWSYDRL